MNSTTEYWICQSANFSGYQQGEQQNLRRRRQAWFELGATHIEQYIWYQCLYARISIVDNRFVIRIRNGRYRRRYTMNFFSPIIHYGLLCCTYLRTTRRCSGEYFREVNFYGKQQHFQLHFFQTLNVPLHLRHLWNGGSSDGTKVEPCYVCSSYPLYPPRCHLSYLSWRMGRYVASKPKPKTPI